MTTAITDDPSVHPKRVILQLRVDHFIECRQEGFEKAIEEYLAANGRSMDEIRSERHFVHIEPFQDQDVPQKYFHIILDLEQDQGPVRLETVPHDLFYIRRTDKGIQLLKAKNPLRTENLLRKMRVYTDDLYPWGRTRA
ncbi:hypothetical protein BDV25DRAFT_139022 [Aspergillus avenaceus]|uniref:Uncharacterized protein n=1 Tax=Aspergillus avenaceus TaxID=36643 RepID=A0A5N6TZ16_ASPAV|nr:hypothetical protein BDV25DRAFT_139022 [Aspergillus avenaceus]